MDLKHKVKKLKQRIAALESELNCANEARKYWQMRLEKAAGEVKTLNNVGNYLVYGQTAYLSSDLPEWQRKRAIMQVAEDLAKALIERNIAQVFDEKPEGVGGPLDGNVVGVKLYVIPWEEMREGYENIILTGRKFK